MESLNIDPLQFEYINDNKKNKTRNFVDLEESVLSCLLQQPSLMESIKLTEKDFIKYSKIFIYFQKFYKTFKTLDLILMINKLKYKDRRTLAGIYDKLIDFEPLVSNFDKYQDALILQNKEKSVELENRHKVFKIINLINDDPQEDYTELVEKIKIILDNIN